MSWLVLIDHLAQLIFLFPFSSVQHVKAFRFQLGLLCQIISDALNVELGGRGVSGLDLWEASCFAPPT